MIGYKKEERRKGRIIFLILKRGSVRFEKKKKPGK